MKLTLASLLLCFSLLSCGPSADGDQAPNERFQFGYQQFFFADREIDPELRSMTLLTMPIEQDVKGFIYQPDRSDWDFVFSSIHYGHRVPYGVRSSRSDFHKTADMIYIVMAAGDVRNDSFERIHHLNTDRNRILARLMPLFAAHPCYLGQRPNHRSCFAEQSDGTVEEPRFAESCGVLERWSWMGLSPEQEEALQDSLIECQEVDGGRLEEIDQQLAYEGDLRDKAKGVVLDLLSAAEAHAGSYFVATGATKGEIDSINGHQSFIQMNAERDGFTQFQLAIDFNIGRGYQLFSLENGLVQNLKLTEQLPGVWALTFKLVNEIFTMEAELSLDVQDIYDLRFSGDTYAYFNDGTVRKGLMKLELDFVPEED